MANDGGAPGPKGSAWTVRPGVPGPPAPAPKPPAPPALDPPPPPANPAIVKVLQSAALFKSFTDTGIALIAGIASEKTLPAHTPLFVENMIGETLFVIAEGNVRIAARGPDGREHVLVHLGAGDTLGEAALLRAGPRLCSAYAETEVRVVEVARRDIANLQKTKPQACIKLLMAIVDVLAARTKDVDPEIKQLISGAP